MIRQATSDIGAVLHVFLLPLTLFLSCSDVHQRRPFSRSPHILGFCCHVCKHYLHPLSEDVGSNACFPCVVLGGAVHGTAASPVHFQLMEMVLEVIQSL